MAAYASTLDPPRTHSTGLAVVISGEQFRRQEEGIPKEEEEEEDQLAAAYIFGRTPSLRLDLPATASPTVPFPASSRPVLERQRSNASFSSSSDGAAPPPPSRPFYLPPGLADSPQPSTVDVKLRDGFRQARGAKISTEPPIPLDIQQLLLTTPPPPRRRLPSSPLVSQIAYPPSPLFDPSVVEEKPSIIKRIRALTLRGTQKEEHAVAVRPRTMAQRTEVLDLRRDGASRARAQEDLLSFPSARNWEEYEKLYATGRFDVEAPPLPPKAITTSNPQSRLRTPLPFDLMTPYDLARFPAPLRLSPLSPIRERLISSLDLLGTFLPDETTLLSPQFSTPTFQSPNWSATSPSSNSTCSPRSRGFSSASTTPSTIFTKSSHLPSPYSRSIQTHPRLQTLVDHLIADGTSTAATITLFPTSPATSYLTVVASSGAASSWNEIGVDLALDSHTILNGSRGLVVYEAETDWRFRGNRELEQRGVSFYAGMPIFAPSSLSLRTSDLSFSVAQFEEEAGGARIAIGVVAVMDDQPRELGRFASTERARLRSVASEITSEIERFVLQRASAIDALSSRRTSATSAATFQSGSISAPSGLRSARADPSTQSTHIRGRNGRGHVKKVSFDANAAGGPPQPLPTASLHLPDPRVASPTFSEPDSIPALFHSHSPQKLLDLACASLFRSLALKLVYLVQLDHLSPRDVSSPYASRIPSLTLIASHGLPPSATPDEDQSKNFDPSLHLTALRAPEGGLLYRAASPLEPFDSGMLLPVTELDNSSSSSQTGGGKGWVIAGYAEQKGRKWGEEEMAIFENVVKGVEKILLWREEWR